MSERDGEGGAGEENTERDLLRARLGVDGGVLGLESGRDDRAAYAGTVEVLESIGGSVEARELGRLGVVRGEAELDGRVVDDEPGGDVLA